MTREDGDSLLDFVSSVAGEELLKVEENLGNGYVRLRVSEAERRQAKHDIRFVEDAVVEMLRNSRDAQATRIFFATSKEGKTRRLACVDDGEGVPEQLHEAIFEPRVTSKLDTMTVDDYGVHGRGMALYSLRANMREARVVWSRRQRGTAMLTLADTSAVRERKDQSTWPDVDLSGDRPKTVKGPHNIVRTVVDFALSVPQVDVYFGSPAEIVATMRALAITERGLGRLFDAASADELSVWHLAGTVADPVRLSALTCDVFGLPISERNAQRVLSEEIAGLRPLLDCLGARPVSPAPSEKAVDLMKDRRSVRLEEADLARLAAALSVAFRPVAEKHYLDPDCETTTSATADEIRIRLRFQKLD